MVKIIIYEVKSCFYQMSLIKKICFVIYLIIYALLVGTESESMIRNWMFVWLPGTVFADFGNVSDMHRLLPVDDKHFKLWLVLKAPIDGLMVSLMVAMASLPWIIKEGTPGWFFRISITILLVSIWNNGCSFKYMNKRMPGILYKVSEVVIFIIIAIMLMAEVEPYSYITDIIEFTGAFLVMGVVLAIKFFLIKDVPVSGMSFVTDSEKR